MVAVFLHLLEYATCVIFLTTNRVQSFDEAFLSRFSIALKYPELSKSARISVWRKFLSICGLQVGKSVPTTGVNGVSPGYITEADLDTLGDAGM